MIVHKRSFGAEVYYFDGQTVRQEVLVGPDERVEAQILALEQIESLYRRQPTPLQSAASLN